MNRALDVLFVSPDSSFQAYQALSKDFSAIEPPTWALLLAQSCRAKGFGVGILDCGAERLSAKTPSSASRKPIPAWSAWSSMARTRTRARPT